MRCARTEFAGRWPGEDDVSPSALPVRVMAKDAPVDALDMRGRYNFVDMAPHGSWVASALDLVKFASAFDDPAACPALTASSVDYCWAARWPTPQVPGPDLYVDRGGEGLAIQKRLVRVLSDHLESRPDSASSGRRRSQN